MGRSALTPQQVVNNKLVFAIPIYQRLFAWSDEQISPLLLDLLYCCVKTKGSHHYIGLLTTKNKDLVDGQQRFTVMTLMALVLREKMTTQIWNDFLHEGDSMRLTFTARKKDGEFLKRLYDMGTCVNYIDRLLNPEEKVNECYYNEMMAKGILTIANFLDNLQTHTTKTLELKTDEVPTIDEFGNYVFEHLAFFIQEMPEGYSPRMMNKYFESMNSTGRNLENHEILKVDLLKAAFPGESNGEEYNKFVSMWNKASQMDKTIFGSAEENTNTYMSFFKGNLNSELHPIKDESMTIKDVLSGKISQLEISSHNQRETRFRSFLNFTDFLLQVLWLELEDKTLKEDDKIIANWFFKRENLGKTFKKYWNYIDSKKDFILKVYKYRIILDWAIIRIDGEGDYELLAESNSDYSKLEQYEAMLFASSSLYTYYNWLPLILKEVWKNGYDQEKLLYLLKKKDIKNHPKPNQVLDYRSGIDTYYFRRLDYYIWEKVVFSGKTEEELKNDLLSSNANFLPGVIESIKSYRFHQYNSIEHLYPRNESLQLELNKWSQNDLQLDHERLLNGFGNLALISSAYNSTQKNQSLNHKFVNVEEHIIKKKIESIKLAIMYCCANGDLMNWTKPKAEAHQKQMETILKDSYNLGVSG